METPNTTIVESTSKPRRRAVFFRWGKWLLWMAALALFVSLILSQGMGELLAALSKIGWAIVLICLYHIIPLLLNTLGWWVLMDKKATPGLGRLFLYRWICQSSNNLLPVAQVGGEFIRARLLARSTGGSVAATSVMVDFTLGIITQAIFTVIGVLLLISLVGAEEQAQNLLFAALLALVPLLLFYVVQRLGMIGLGARLVSSLVPGEKWQQLVGSIHTLNETVMSLYRRHVLILSGSALRLLAWFSCAVETWLTFYFLGQPISVVDAIIFECVGYAARSMAFVIPGAVGVTEAALVLVGSLMGVGAGPSLVLAMVKRIRELFIGIPGLLLWMRMENRKVG